MTPRGRFALIVLDGVGIGTCPDQAAYGDQTQIAMWDFRPSGPHDLILYAADSSASRTLISPPYKPQAVHWSADSTQLYYLRNLVDDPAQFDLFVLDIATGTERRLTYTTAATTHLNIQPEP